MEIRKKTINNTEYSFVNETWENYNSWGHKTTILRGNCELITNKVRYYNRTWECYTYQTCMDGAVNTLIDEELQRYIENYKEDNGITRFKKGQKEEVINQFKETENYKDLQALKEAVRDRNFD